MDINKEREAFEDFVKEKFKSMHEERRKGNFFASNTFDSMFASWLEAKASVAEGFVLVPKEPTKDTLIEIASVCIGDDYANLDEAKELYNAAIKESIEAQELSHD